MSENNDYSSDHLNKITAGRTGDQTSPEAVLLCGAPGSGKTKSTLTIFQATHRQLSDFAKLNQDDIRIFYKVSHGTAGWVMDEVLDLLIAQRYNILIDMTCRDPRPGGATLGKVDLLREAGYRIVMVLVYAPLRLSLARLRRRSDQPTPIDFAEMAHSQVAAAAGDYMHMPSSVLSEIHLVSNAANRRKPKILFSRVGDTVVCRDTETPFFISIKQYCPGTAAAFALDTPMTQQQRPTNERRKVFDALLRFTCVCDNIQPYLIHYEKMMGTFEQLLREGFNHGVITSAESLDCDEAFCATLAEVQHLMAPRPWLEKLANAISGADAKIKGAWTSYIASGCVKMNGLLRKRPSWLRRSRPQDDYDDEMTNDLRHTADLQTFIMKQPGTPSPFYVWRCVSKEFGDEIVTKKSFVSTGFLSTSIELMFECHTVLRIRVPKGARAIVGATHEAELVFPHGVTIRVNSVVENWEGWNANLNLKHPSLFTTQSSYRLINCSMVAAPIAFPTRPHPYNWRKLPTPPVSKFCAPRF